MSDFLVAALYHFTRLDDYEDKREPLLQICVANDVKGTLLLAAEGINGTIAGPDAGIKAVLDYIRSDERLKGLEYKESRAPEMPFLRMKVRLKREIVTMGVEGIDPNLTVGTYVDPKDWNALISDPDVVLVDTRNDYEVAIGTFKNAVDPKTKTFREFPDWAKRNHNLLAKPKVAMFCTGGIRCEKSTAFMKEQGYDEVFHLKGGILKYLEDVPAEESLWEGECFVFDSRVSVGHGLEPGPYDMCHACRMPISEEDKLKAEYQSGVSCHHCYDDTSAAQKQRFEARQRQMDNARRKGLSHIGDAATKERQRRKEEKLALREQAREANCQSGPKQSGNQQAE